MHEEINTYVDRNNRINYNGKTYIPQYSPYLFRNKFIRNLIGCGWSNWHATESICDSTGRLHEFDTTVMFDSYLEALNWIKQNKF